MDFAFTKIYVKLYISQILSSISYYEMKNNQMEIEKFFDENFNENNNHSKSKTITHEEMVKYKKLIVYNNIVYSNVEIMGLIVEIQTLGIDENKLRHILYIDDTTGIIQAIIWKNYNSIIYEKVSSYITCGKLIRIRGHLDNFLSSFEIIVENFEIINSLNSEIVFHQSLQKCQERIKETNIFQLNTMKMNHEKSESKIKSYYQFKKNFSNRILAFCQNFKFNNEIMHDGYIQISVEDFYKTTELMNMLEEFCMDNMVDDKDKFLKDCFNTLEEQTLGRMCNEYVEIKTENIRVKNEILNLLKSNEGVNYMLIFDHISKTFNNFYCTDYVKFVLNQMISTGMIFQLGANTYQLI